MTIGRQWTIPIANFAMATVAGIVAARVLPLSLWKPVFPGLLVALSMLGAAALVRLARNAPITAPGTFDETDLRRFFDTLEELNRRLFGIFIQVVAALAVVLFSVFLAEYRGTLFGAGPALARLCSGFIAFAVIWLLTRLVAMAKGDIGFLKLQRHILENALARQRAEAAAKLAGQLVEFRSPGGYGRALGQPETTPKAG